MADEEVYVARLGAFVARALGNAGELAAHLDTEGLGFQLPDAIITAPSVVAAGTTLASGAAVLSDAADELDAAVAGGDEGALFSAIVHLLEGVYGFVDGMTQLVDRISTAAAALPPPDRAAVQTFGAVFARRTLDALVMDVLERELPRVVYLLRLLGLVEWRLVPASGQPGETRHVQKALRLERFGELVRDPAGTLAAVHGWGTPTFEPSGLMDAFSQFFRKEMSMERGMVGGDAFLAFGPFRWSRDSSANPPGLMLDWSAKTSRSFDQRIGIDDKWGLDFESSLTVAGGIIFRLAPPFAVSAEPKTGSVSGAIGFKVNRNPTARGFTIVGGNDLVHLTADDLSIGANLTLGASTTGQVDIDPGVSLDLKGLTLELGTEGSDNFLASLLASADVRGVFDLGLGWSLSRGLVVKAAGGLEIAIPMHQDLGIARLETLYLVFKIRDDASLALELSVGITGLLGPLTATVERMGVELTLAFTDSADASLGAVDLKLGFKPPSGVGLAIDAGIVKGGGYLYLDYEKGEYAGALELVFSGFLALKAIGLITTRMPDGSDGFSLLIIITAEFGTPIQLGFGFTLNGVGGLLGLNRSMRLEELAEGVRTGAVENVMFPHDVIANAPQIISDMKRFFPVEVGTFLIGPMAKLGWGTPSLITVSLGVIIEIPPGNVAILGVLSCVLPDEDAALLVLKVKFIGALEVDKQRLWFFASLFGSRVLFITLDGELGLLIAWGDKPAFVLSAGGFHPKFSPPPLPFPTPHRIALSILDTSFARIRVEAYFAVTSNTAQFGAHAELFFGLEAFSIDGELGFDALFQFSPFYFEIALSCSLSVKVFGIGLFSVGFRGELSGTSPWHIEGEGSISLLFFSISVPFSHTWGDEANTSLPPLEALPIFKRELEKRENWVALLPTGSQISVSLRKLEAAAELVLHPLGMLRVSQRAVPFELGITKVGNQQVTDIARASLSVTTTGLERKAAATEPFARSQFVELDAAARLSAPDFEPQMAGIDLSVTGNDTRTSHAVKRVVLHELVTIDTNFKHFVRRFFNVGKAWFLQMLGSNATARSSLSKAEKQARVPFTDKVTTAEPGYAIANLEDNSQAEGVATFGSHAGARDALERHLASNPDARAKLHVIPVAELRRAA
jgi:uncharacterized protein DUF6603